MISSEQLERLAKDTRMTLEIRELVETVNELKAWKDKKEKKR